METNGGIKPHQATEQTTTEQENNVLIMMKHDEL